MAGSQEIDDIDRETDCSVLRTEVVAECQTSKARACLLKLPHGEVHTPVFMPVGTQGTLKGMLPEQLEELGVEIMLGNTYHLGHRPGPELLEKAGGLHNFMHWNRPLLTDSGGYQMVSLLKLAEITEDGVKFNSPHDNTQMLLTPEHSTHIQNIIGADITMQLDDVVHSKTTGPRVEEAMHRTIRWLDRCITAQNCSRKQCIFPIVQGGLDQDLRIRCIKELVKRDCCGYAIGGLSGGEEKAQFWQMVSLSTDHLPKDKIRYLMGVGYAVDLVVCVALGCDMFDCVYPTRTARFGRALVPWGLMDLKRSEFRLDFSPIDPDCSCSTCRTHTRAYLHAIVTYETTACHLLTVHNLAYQVNLMSTVRRSIIDGEFPEFVRRFLSRIYPDGSYPDWILSALASVNIHVRR